MIEKKFFGTATVGYAAGLDCHTYTLSAEGNPLTVVLSDFGARIVKITGTLPCGCKRTLTRGFAYLSDYETASGYLGAVVGRYGNRIRRGLFTLDGKEYSLFINNGVNSLHGGKNGFDRKLWKAVCTDGAEPSVIFSTVSPDGEEGYPGSLTASVKYTLTKSGLRLEYIAETDAPTYINLTNHVYFNLSGKGSIEDHTVTLDCDRYLPTDETLIPTGELKPVDGTVFDFRSGRKIGDSARSDDADIVTAGGVDHCFVFRDMYSGFKARGTAVSPDGRVTLELLTDRPCVQFYSGNFLGDDPNMFYGTEKQEKRAGFCLETQGMPDAMNHEGFTNVRLNPGEVYMSATEFNFRFS
ncbi:MAG: galactose mutarotase [Clostridia bacterium]|nr:galactose mutarotase [Clostridia bacterium]